jgi:hypothetical protein
VPGVDLRLAVGETADLGEVGELRPADLVDHDRPGEAERDDCGHAWTRSERA